MNKKILLILTGIILVASVLRLWHLESVPPSLDWDEASWGYNAYSLLQTGKDEYGKFLPVVIRSLNDYKPALYAYLDVPSIALFGLSDFAVRLPNAIFGILTVLTTYFLVKELFKKNSLSLISSFLLAISPWSIQFSRFAHEGMVGLEFNLLMILFFLKGLKKPKLLSLSAVFAALSLYSYQNEKLFVPLLGIVLLFIYHKELFVLAKKYLLSAFLVGLILSLPILIFTITTPESFTRAKGASFLSDPAPVFSRLAAEKGDYDKKNGDIIGKIFDNRRIVYGKKILSNYLSHFDPNFLFVKGDPLVPRHQPPLMGHLFLLELPFLLIGLFALIFGKFERSTKKLILAWMLIVPIPAAFTWDVPNAGRTMNFLPTFQILIALGLLSAYAYVSKFKKSIKLLICLVFAVLGIFNFAYYLNQYFVQYPYFNSQDWQYGYKEVISIVKENEHKYRRIYVSTRIPLDQSYIFFLYNLKFPPAEYHKYSNSKDISYQQSKHFGKYYFQDENWEEDIAYLYIGRLIDFPADKRSNAIRIVKFLNGDDAIMIIDGTR